MSSNLVAPEEITVGVVGLGLMGSSIATCLLLAGHRVVAVAPVSSDVSPAWPRIHGYLQNAFHEGVTGRSADSYAGDLVITEDYTLLAPCALVIECVIENVDVKREVFSKIESVVGSGTVITSNTSAIPISELQREAKIPCRFLGLHWADPAHTTRFLEIICGDTSDVLLGEWLYALSRSWGKEPTLVRKDIRGFIANRLMYAMYREAFYLVENGYATIEDVDRACRNNSGYWMTLVGVFRWMDLTGVPAYHAVMKDLFPTLNNQQDVPALMRKVVENGGKGIANQNGFYSYTPEQARLWKETFEEFTYEIRRLALKYPEDVVEKQIQAE